MNVKLTLYSSSAGLPFAQASKAPREAAHALHALFEKAVGQCEKLKPRTKTVGDRKKDRKRKLTSELRSDYQTNNLMFNF